MSALPKDGGSYGTTGLDAGLDAGFALSGRRRADQPYISTTNSPKSPA